MAKIGSYINKIQFELEETIWIGMVHFNWNSPFELE